VRGAFKPPVECNRQTRGLEGEEHRRDAWRKSADALWSRRHADKFEDPPEDELEGDGVSASDQVLAP
jgi:hypothetical protein